MFPLGCEGAIVYTRLSKSSMWMKDVWCTCIALPQVFARYHIVLVWVRIS